MIARVVAMVLLIATGAASTPTPTPIPTPTAAPTPSPMATIPWQGLPMPTKTSAHRVGDPINIGLEGTKATILAAFKTIGWEKADPLSFKNDLHLAEAALHHGSYRKAPVSKLFLFGRVEDFAVEHELGWVARRDHARFWDTGRQDTSTHLEMWVGDSSRDTGIKVLMRGKVPVGTTHRIDGDLDKERRLIVSALQTAGLVSKVIMEPGIGPTTNAHNGGGDRYFTDGQVAIVVLKTS
jgi:LssY C-terminus